MQFFPNDSDQCIDRHRDPDLRLDRIFRGTEKLLDTKMLLDPFEEQLDLPAAFVKSADGFWRQDHLIGEEDERLAGFRVAEADPAQMRGVILFGIEAIQRNRLVAEDANTALCLSRINSMSFEIRLGASDEEGTGQMQAMQAPEVDIATIHDVDRTGFRRQQIQRMHVVQFAVRDMDEAGDVASQIEQRMHLHRRLGGAKQGPREERQTQIDARLSGCHTHPLPVVC